MLSKDGSMWIIAVCHCSDGIPTGTVGIYRNTEKQIETALRHAPMETTTRTDETPCSDVKKSPEISNNFLTATHL